MVAPRLRPGRSVPGRVGGGLARVVTALFPGAPQGGWKGGRLLLRPLAACGGGLAAELRRKERPLFGQPRKLRGRRTEPRPEAAGPGRVRGQPLPHSARALPPFPGPRALPSLQPARPRDFVGCSSHSAPMSPPLCSLLGLRFRGCSWELEKLWASENAKEAGALPLSSAGRVDAGQEPRALPSLPRP